VGLTQPPQRSFNALQEISCIAHAIDFLGYQTWQWRSNCLMSPLSDKAEWVQPKTDVKIN